MNSNSRKKHQGNFKNSNRRRPHQKARGQGNRSGRKGTSGRSFGQSQSPKRFSENELFQKYDRLLEIHNNARKKYFELYFTANSAQKGKLKKNSDSSLQQLRKFESSLAYNSKRILENRYRGKPDHTYSETHNLNPKGEYVRREQTFEDVHLLKEQEEYIKVYREDREESSGSMDDYIKLKQTKKNPL